MFKFLQIVALMLVVQSLYAADKLQWGTPNISQDGHAIIRYGYIPGEQDHLVIGFFSSAGKLHRQIETEYEIMRDSMSRDGYLGVVGEELTGKVLFLYCPLGHLIWKVDISKVGYPPQIAINDDGKIVAGYFVNQIEKKGEERKIEIFGADGKKINSFTSPSDADNIDFIDDENLLITSKKNVVAFNVNTGKNVWVTNVAFDFFHGQSVAISPDRETFLIVDFIRNKTKTELLLTPRMRVFKSKTGEIITQKTFEPRNFDIVPNTFLINNDVVLHKFSINIISDMSINY